MAWSPPTQGAVPDPITPSTGGAIMRPKRAPLSVVARGDHRPTAATRWW